MKAQHWRDLILKVAADPSDPLMAALVDHLAACERAKQILRAKGYGEAGTPIDKAAEEVPDSGY